MQCGMLYNMHALKEKEIPLKLNANKWLNNGTTECRVMQRLEALYYYAPLARVKSIVESSHQSNQLPVFLSPIFDGTAC